MTEAVSCQTPSIGLRQPLGAGSVELALLTFRSQPWRMLTMAVSMVGAYQRNTQHIDHYAWGRAALYFVGVTVEHHETLAEHLGGSTVAEVLLLIIACKCKTSKRKWEQAKDLGIPWLNKVGGPW